MEQEEVGNEFNESAAMACKSVIKLIGYVLTCGYGGFGFKLFIANFFFDQPLLDAKLKDGLVLLYLKFAFNFLLYCYPPLLAFSSLAVTDFYWFFPHLAVGTSSWSPFFIPFLLTVGLYAIHSFAMICVSLQSLVDSVTDVKPWTRCMKSFFTFVLHIFSFTMGVVVKKYIRYQHATIIDQEVFTVFIRIG